ncbi:hypothetical protein ABZ383_32490, partial [Streptomyces sp. NPDC005900]|uniref:hypothetical protein n=1 Tax=unclassified Streptomyces TaxID=2593676 RepID=UPI0033DCD613
KRHDTPTTATASSRTKPASDNTIDGPRSVEKQDVNVPLFAHTPEANTLRQIFVKGRYFYLFSVTQLSHTQLNRTPGTLSSLAKGRGNGEAGDH